MELNIEKNTVTIYSKNYKLDQIAQKLAQLNGSQVYSFFTNRGIFVPRKLNCYAMISILNDKLKLLNSNSLSKDYFTRLQYYKSFSELQLFNLYKEIATFDDFKNYRISLFKLVLINHVGLNLTDGEIQYLINLKKLPMESFEEYFDQVSCSCFEQENTFDGQDIDVLKETLEFSASNTEITGLGEKYGIPVPQRLRKTDILEYLYWYLGKENRLTRELKQTLDAMTITDISNYIKNENVGISANMTKPELVNYLFFILSQYDIPTTTMKRVELLEEYEPLEFKVDLNVINNFKSDEPKKVIHFKHDSSDAEYYEALSDLYHTTKKQDEIIQKEENIKTLTLEHEEIAPQVQKKLSIAEIKARQMGANNKPQADSEEDDLVIAPIEEAPKVEEKTQTEEQPDLEAIKNKAKEEKAKEEALKKEASEKAKEKAKREAEEKAALEAKAKAEAEKKARDAQILAQAQAYIKQYEEKKKKLEEAKKQQAQQYKTVTQKKIVKTITKPNGEKVTVEFTPEQFAALKAKQAAQQAGQPVDIASIVKAQALQKAQEDSKAKSQAQVEPQAQEDLQAEEQQAPSVNSLEQPVVAQSDSVESQPVSTESAIEEPVESQAVSTETATEEPVESQAVSTETATEEPVESQAVSTESATEEPVESQAVSTESAKEEPVESQVVSTESATEEPVDDESQVEVPVESVEFNSNVEANVSFDNIEEQLGDSFSWDLVEEMVSDDDSFGWTVEEVETVIYVDENGNEIEGYDESMAGDDVVLVAETVDSSSVNRNSKYIDDEDNSDFVEPAFNTPAYYEDGTNAVRSNLVKSSKDQPLDDKPLSNGLEDERSFLSLNVVVKNANYGDKKLDKLRKKK